MSPTSTSIRVLVINPNTSQWVTDALTVQLQTVIGDESGIALDSVTGTIGASYIASETAYAVAGYACLDRFAACYDGHDAVVIGCFGDPAIGALRELSPVPVIGMAEVAMREAAADGPFAIITGGAAWPPMLMQLARAFGFGDTLRTVIALEQSAGELAANRERALDLLAGKCRLAQHEGAHRMVLGGAAFAGYGDALAERTGLPVIDSVSAVARAIKVLSVDDIGASRVIVAPPGGANYLRVTKSMAKMLSIGARD